MAEAAVGLGLVAQLCTICRRHRTEFAASQFLPCCAERVYVCAEKCAEMIPRVHNFKSTVEQYLAFYCRVHKLVCRDRFRM